MLWQLGAFLVTLPTELQQKGKDFQMRWLKLIAATQLLVTGVLAWRVLALEQSLDARTVPVPAGDDVPMRTAQPYSSSSADSFPHESVLRDIIREELHAVQASKSHAQMALPPAPEPVYSKTFENQRDMVSARLDSVISAGVINASDMERIQIEIGRLHPRDRRAALSQLAKAINAGTVKLTH